VRRAAALAVFALACAAPPAPPSAPLAPAAVSSVERVPHTVGAFGADAARLPVSVRMASEADLAGIAPPKDQVRDILKMSGQLLLASGALAALGCPICLSNAVVAAGFAIVGTPIIAAVDAIEHAEARRVAAALAAADLPARTGEALARLRPDAAPGAAGAELLIVGYGFAEAGADDACWFLEASLRAGDREETILLGPWRRSDDAPAPHCASRKDLAAGDGRLTAHVVDESAEILAGLVTTRLAESP
jgi:hypothetical protein